MTLLTRDTSVAERVIGDILAGHGVATEDLQIALAEVQGALRPSQTEADHRQLLRAAADVIVEWDGCGEQFFTGADWHRLDGAAQTLKMVVRHQASYR